MRVTDDEIRERIRQYVVRSNRMDAADFSDETNLHENGIIDSLALAAFISFLETEFDLRIEDKYFFDERFSCVRGLAEIIREIEDTGAQGR
jgi:acyl carrier protein